MEVTDFYKYQELFLSLKPMEDNNDSLLRRARFDSDELREKSLDCPICLSFPIDPQVCVTCEGYICSAELDEWLDKGNLSCPRCSEPDASFEEIRRIEREYMS